MTSEAEKELLLRVSGGLDSDASGIDPESEICWTPTISLTIAEMRTIARVLREAAEAKTVSDDFMWRVAKFFDADLTAGSFLREDGEGGFIGGMHRMAREIDRLREAAEGWRPISEAKKDGTVVWAKLRDDIYPALMPGRDDLARWNGVQIPLRHPGLAEDGFDIGWGVAAPVGHGGFPDEWVEGFRPLPAPPSETGK